MQARRAPARRPARRPAHRSGERPLTPHILYGPIDVLCRYRAPQHHLAIRTGDHERRRAVYAVLLCPLLGGPRLFLEAALPRLVPLVHVEPLRLPGQVRQELVGDVVAVLRALVLENQDSVLSVAVLLAGSGNRIRLEKDQRLGEELCFSGLYVASDHLRQPPG